MAADSKDPDVQRLLGVLPGNGAALGLEERWAYAAIKAVGNYGQIFDRHFGLYVDRGMNRLARDGGLMYSPPLR
jgi:general L-amino acid transport system substrate-binding protein